jgi:3-deoxy-7-phosphoheptulonate synthase
MQNFNLLDAVGEIRQPVLVKRGMAASYEEWLLAAEYVMARGNDQVIVCEQGIRCFERYTQFTFDISAIPVIKQLSHLPIIADPSHSTGKWRLVTPVALAAIASGADGLMVEVSLDPVAAKSESSHALTLESFSSMTRQAQALAALLRRESPASCQGALADLHAVLNSSR